MSWSGKSRRTKGELGENRHDLGGWPALHPRPLLLLLLHLPHPRSVVPPVINASALSEQESPRNWWPTLPGSKSPNRPPRHPLANLWPAAGHPLATPPGNKGVTGRARQQREECPTQLRGAGRARGGAPPKDRWAPRNLGGPQWPPAAPQWPTQWPPVAPSGPPPPTRGDTITEGPAITHISK